MEAGPRAGVAGAAALLFDEHEHGVIVAVKATLAHVPAAGGALPLAVTGADPAVPCGFEPAQR